MKRDDLITLLLRRAGQREGDPTLRNQLESEIQFLQESFEQNGVQLPSGGVFWPNFLVSEISTNTSTIDEPRLDLPDDFLVEYDEGALFLLQDGEWICLQKDQFDLLRKEYSSSSQPEYYAQVGDYFYLFPVPNGQYTLKLLYYQAAAELTSDIENRWLKYAQNLMLSALGYVMASQYLYDQQLASSFAQQQQKAAFQLYSKEISQEQANTDPVMGEIE